MRDQREACVSPETDGGTSVRPTFIGALRADPQHASELALCAVLPNLATHARRWHDAVTQEQAPETEGRANSVVRRTTAVARRDGAVTGTSFYVGMPAAMASIYCHQLLMVLKIAALNGHDPHDPARAAEILVLRGGYPDVGAATEALATLGVRDRPATDRGTIGQVVRLSLGSVPGKVREKLDQARKKGLLAAVVAVVQIASYVVPFIGVPVWAASYARSTRQLGKKAVSFYTGAHETLGPPAPADQALATAWARLPSLPRHLLLILAAVALVMTVLFVVIARTVVHHRGGRFTLALAGIFVLGCYARLCYILRPDRSAATA
jgi:hypothetical protein